MGLSGHLAGDCPGGLCNYLVLLSELIVVLLLIDGFIFLVTLIPPLFSWKSVQPDSKKRIFFALFACVTFYLWLTLLAIHSFYCFGFLAHSGIFSFNDIKIVKKKITPFVHSFNICRTETGLSVYQKSGKAVKCHCPDQNRMILISVTGYPTKPFFIMPLIKCTVHVFVTNNLFVVTLTNGLE